MRLTPVTVSATNLLAHPAVQLIARIAAVGAVIATGLVYLGSVLIAPMPWPFVFTVVWLSFVIATILAARQWAYRPLLLPVISLAFIVIALWVGQDIFGWAP